MSPRRTTKADLRRHHAPMSALLDRPEFADVRRELTAWVEDRLAEAAHPGRGRRLKGLAAIFDRRLKQLPPRERRQFRDRYPRIEAARPSLADRLTALADLRPPAPGEGPLVVADVEDLLSPLPRVSYEVTSVHCTRSTNEISADELYVTLFTGGPVGTPAMLGPRKLGDFRNGDSVTCTPPVATAPLPLQAADGFQSFLALAYCAEVDRDEYLELMPAIYEELLAEGTIPVILEQSASRDILVMMIIGESLAAACGILLTLVSPAAGIAVIVGAITAIVAEITAFWSTDEMFTMHLDVLEFPVDIEHPPAAQLSPNRTFSLTGYGADYSVTTRWRIA